MQRLAPLLALSPVFAVGFFAALRYNLPIVAALIALSFAGFFIAYARTRPQQ
jgi:hypothetical protein